MPCKGSRSNGNEYGEVLDELYEIVVKYSNNHYIILAGDLNAQLTSDKPDKQDQLLKNFCAEVGLTTIPNYPNKPTFLNTDGIGCTHIDHVISTKDAALHINSIWIEDELINNTSDHHPVCATTTLRIVCTTTNTDKQIQPGNNRINWDKADLTVYQTYLDDRYREDSKQIRTAADLDQEIEAFHDTLNEAARLACPRKRAGKRAKNRTWNDKISEAAASNKTANYRWKSAGRPKEPDHPTVIERKKARSHFRQVMRQEIAMKRDQKLEAVMEAHGSDRNAFYKLIGEQRSTKTTNAEEIVVEGKLLKGPKEMCEGWKDHFEKLATPAIKEGYVESYKQDTDIDIQILKDITQSQQLQMNSFTYIEIQKAITRLNNKKAPDLYGITAEHLKNASPAAIGKLMQMLNYVIKVKKVPASMKAGVLTPVYKKKKSKQDPFSYRGITVTAIVGKVLEILIRNLIVPQL
jgi:hypothetical protein